jgi:hypothetical protein
VQFFGALRDVLFQFDDRTLLQGASEQVKKRVADGSFSVNLVFASFEKHFAYTSLLARPSQTSPSVDVGKTVFTYDESAKGAYYLLVNAWDPLSFIGNGGSRDGSLDGWFGGGYAYPKTEKFACTCWLSNIFMIPELVNHAVAV